MRRNNARKEDDDDDEPARVTMWTIGRYAPDDDVYGGEGGKERGGGERNNYGPEELLGEREGRWARGKGRRGEGVTSRKTPKEKETTGVVWVGFCILRVRELIRANIGLNLRG